MPVARIKKRDASGVTFDAMPTSALVLRIPSADLLKRRQCHLHLEAPPPAGTYVLVEQSKAVAIVKLGELDVVESGRGHKKTKGYPFTVEGVFREPLDTDVPADADGVVEHYELLAQAATEKAVPVQKPFAGYEDFDQCVADQIAHGHDEVSARNICGKLQAEAEKTPARKQVDLDETGEGGIHVHALDRAAQATGTDGAHKHVFVLPTGEVVVTEHDGDHSHALMSQAADVAEPGSSAHTHVVVLPDGTEVETMAGGEHMHTLQVRQTAFDGAHQHELKFGETTLHSLTPGEFYAQFGDSLEVEDDDEEEDASEEKRLHDKLSTLHTATRGIKLSSHALSLIATQDDSITVMAHGCLSPEMTRAVEKAMAARLPESVATRLRVIDDSFGVPCSATVPLAHATIDFGEEFAVVQAKGDDLTRRPVGKHQRAVMQYVFNEAGGFNTVLRFQADEEVISWSLATGRSESLHKRVESVRDAEVVSKAADLDGSRYQRPIRGVETAAEPSVSTSLVMLDHVGKVFGADVAGLVTTVAEGEVEYGLQLDGFHEYFVGGNTALRGVIRAKRAQSGAWTVTAMKTLLPAVLSSAAVEAGVMPPLGTSSLPASLEREVPPDLRYWRASTEKAAQAIRDELVARGCFREDTVELVEGEFRRVYTRVEQAIAKSVPPLDTTLPPPRPPVHVDPVRKVAKLLPGDGADVVLFDRSLAATTAPSQVCALATKAAQSGDDFLIAYPDSPGARLSLAKVGRLFHLPGHAETLFVTSAPIVSEAVAWLPEPAQMVESGGSERVSNLLKRMGGTHRVRLLKSPEERFVFGIVLEPETVDAQDDIYSEDEIRKAAHLYMEEAGHIKLMHKGAYIDGAVKILENYVAPVAMEIDGHPVKKGTWLLGVRVLDDSLWNACKSGELTGFSIGGTAVKTPV